MKRYLFWTLFARWGRWRRHGACSRDDMDPDEEAGSRWRNNDVRYFVNLTPWKLCVDRRAVFRQSELYWNRSGRKKKTKLQTSKTDLLTLRHRRESARGTIAPSDVFDVTLFFFLVFFYRRRPNEFSEISEDRDGRRNNCVGAMRERQRSITPVREKFRNCLASYPSALYAPLVLPPRHHRAVTRSPPY